MSDKKKYDFSITTASLRLNEWNKVIDADLGRRELDIVQDLGGGKSKTATNMYREFVKRNAHFTPSQLSLFADTDLTSQKQLALLSICKLHRFVGEFVIEVLREKALLFDYKIHESDYTVFMRRKTELHEELDLLTENTRYKIKQVTFKILEESGLIDNVKTKIIQPQILSPDVIDVIKKDNKEWLKLFFWSDYEIENR